MTDQTSHSTIRPVMPPEENRLVLLFSELRGYDIPHDRSERVLHDVKDFITDQVELWRKISVRVSNALQPEERQKLLQISETVLSNYSSLVKWPPGETGGALELPLPSLVHTLHVEHSPPHLAIGYVVGAFVEAAKNIAPLAGLRFNDLTLRYVAQFYAARDTFSKWVTAQSNFSAIETELKDVNAKINANAEYKALRDVTKVWQKRGEKLHLTVIVSFMFIGAAILMILVAAFNSGPDFLNALRSPEKNGQPGEITYGAVALAFVPIIAVGWLLRIVGRVTTTSLTLQDDAEHRAALLSTYFNLIGDPNAKLEPSDRLLILTAIFRPLPGQDNDEMSPLAVEFVKKAFEKDGK